jgi:chromosome partitioning protein
MTLRVAIANLKGGVGKSTTTLFLSETLALMHQLRVLVVDLDPQSNTSFMLLSRDGVDQAERSGKTLNHFLLETAQGHPPNPNGYICPRVGDILELRPSNYRGRVDLLASVPKMWFVEMLRDKKAYMEHLDPAEELCRALGEHLSSLDGWYDVIIFDCPPGFSSLTRAGLLSADAVISPTIADAVSIRSLSDFVEYGLGEILRIRDVVPHYVIVSKYRAVAHYAREVDWLKRRYDVLEPYVRDSVDMATATERIRFDSLRSFRAKYQSMAADVQRLTDQVLRYVVKPRG